MKGRWILALAVAMWSPSLAAAVSPKATVEVRGTGEVTVPADRVILHFSIVTSHGEVLKARERNDQLTKQIYEAGEALQIPRPALLTTALSLEFASQQHGPSEQKAVQQQWPQAKGTAEPFQQAEATPSLQMVREVEVRCGRLEQAVALLAKVVPWEAVAKTHEIRVLPLRCDVTDRSKSLAEARRRAVTQAREKAEVLAEQAGHKLGPVRQVVDEECGASALPRPYDPYDRDPFSAPVGTLGVPLHLVALSVEAAEGFDLERLPPAQIRLTVTVRIVFELE